MRISNEILGVKGLIRKNFADKKHKDDKQLLSR